MKENIIQKIFLVKEQFNIMIHYNQTICKWRERLISDAITWIFFDEEEMTEKASRPKTTEKSLHNIPKKN